MILFNIPDNTYELLSIENTIELVKNNVDGRIKTISNNVRKDFLKILTKELFKLGTLSTPLFQLRVPMEKAYLEKYGRRIGKNKFLNHYESIHAPYDILKELVFGLIEKLDPKNEGY
jgi:hypothetical protein